MNCHFASFSYIMLVSLCLCLSGCEKESVIDKARKFTVRIITEDKGATGIILAKNKDNYKILVNMHTARPYIEIPAENIISPSESEKKIMKNKASHGMKAITFDNAKHNIFNCRPLSKDNEIDLAICNFKSDVNYNAAVFSKDIDLSKQVYLFGYKGCFKNKENQYYEEFNTGEIISDKNKDKAEGNKSIKKFTPPKKNKEHDTYYTNASIGGMSGAPLLNDKAEVIAVHAMAGNNRSNIEDAMLQSCASLSREFENNWGISTKIFIDFIQ
jgi:uncharacterized protein YpmB